MLLRRPLLAAGVWAVRRTRPAPAACRQAATTVVAAAEARVPLAPRHRLAAAARAFSSGGVAGAGASYPEVREAVRALCARFPHSYWDGVDAARAYPAEFVAALQEAGYLSILVPEQYGGSGLPLSAACAVLEEIHASGGNGGAAHAQMYTMGTLLYHGTEAQRQRWLPGIATGAVRLQAFGVSEPDSGTDTLSLRTAATPCAFEGDAPTHYRVNGQKMWTSRAEHSDLMLLLCRTAPEDGAAGRAKALSLFVVDMQDAKNQAAVTTEGGEVLKGGHMEITPVRTMMNHSTTQVFFDNVVVPAANRIGKEGDGLKCILTSMNAERTLIASESIGDARFFIDKAVAYAKERVVFGRPIGQNQGIQFPIAEAYAQTQAAALMVAAAASKYEAGEPAGAEANMAKYLAAEASWKAGDMCMQTHGGYAFAADFGIERKFRESTLYRVAPISTNLILSFLSEKVLGLPRSF